MSPGRATTTEPTEPNEATEATEPRPGSDGARSDGDIALDGELEGNRRPEAFAIPYPPTTATTTIEHTENMAAATPTRRRRYTASEGRLVRRDRWNDCERTFDDMQGWCHEHPFEVKGNIEQMFAFACKRCYRPANNSSGITNAEPRKNPKEPVMSDALSERQRQILACIEQAMRDRGYPPSVREIGEAVGLSSSSTVHAHLETLQRLGFLRRDPTKPRAIEVRYDPATGSQVERRPVRHVPLIGDVAAGTGVLSEERVEEVFPLPEDFTGDGNLFMLRVRGESMIEVGILDGDFVVVHQQPEVRNGDVVVAGIPGEEATVKTYRKEGDEIVLVPHNAKLSPMRFPPAEVTIYGKVVTVLRRM